MLCSVRGVAAGSRRTVRRAVYSLTGKASRRAFRAEGSGGGWVIASLSSGVGPGGMASRRVGGC